MSVTHIAGIVVKVNDRIIQRCALCGEKLIDTAYNNTAIVWKEHSFVNLDGNQMTVTEPTLELPEDNCLPLVEY